MVSKQTCDKPVSSDFWSLAVVEKYWDQLHLRSWADGIAYQDGLAEAMLHPRTLMEAYGGLEDGGVMFCGTLPVAGGIHPADQFIIELFDPMHPCSITHEYRVQPLPIVG